MKNFAQVRLPVFLHLLVAILTLATFLTGTDLFPFIKNTVGPFELSAMILIGAALHYFYKHHLPLRFHPIFLIMTVWTFMAWLSLFKLTPGQRFGLGVVNVVILWFVLVLTIVLYNLLLLHPTTYLRYFLGTIAVSTAIVGIWVLMDQITSGNDLAANGPFKARAHQGIYMLGALWLALIYLFWPGITRWERWGVYGVLGLAVYGIGTSGRRSIYVALIVGLAGLVISFIVMRGRQRFKISGLVIVLLGFATFFVVVGSQYIPQLAFFQERIGMIGHRLEVSFASADELSEDDKFSAGQLEGALGAFRDHPLIGIGWMGFWRSEYSPTGHELHSSTLRFVAELGVIGIIIYIAFTGYCLLGAFRLFLLARETPYQNSAFVLLTALFSVSVSYYYNRMFTDRTFWLLLSVFLVFETFMLNTTRSTPITSSRSASEALSDSTLATSEPEPTTVESRPVRY